MVGKKKKRKTGRNAVADEAAEIACAWLARHGLMLEEVTKIGVDGREWNAAMRITCPSGKTTTDYGLQQWDWAGSEFMPRDEAWLRVVEWLFLKDFSGPSWVQETTVSEPSPGWSRVRKRRFPVPKLAFSTLAEFVLKASVHPDFPSPDDMEVS
jgi:hypothetical protein